MVALQRRSPADFRPSRPRLRIFDTPKPIFECRRLFHGDGHTIQFVGQTWLEADARHCPCATQPDALIPGLVIGRYVIDRTNGRVLPILEMPMPRVAETPLFGWRVPGPSVAGEMLVALGDRKIRITGERWAMEDVWFCTEPYIVDGLRNVATTLRAEWADSGRPLSYYDGSCYRYPFHRQPIPVPGAGSDRARSPR